MLIQCNFLVVRYQDDAVISAVIRQASSSMAVGMGCPRAETRLEYETGVAVEPDYPIAY